MRQTLAHHPSQPNLVVGWAAGLVQVWPAEDLTIGAHLLCDADDDIDIEAPRLAS
jgi:hypothetical protein